MLDHSTSVTSEDAFGTTTTYTYETTGWLKTITDANNKTKTFGYDDAGRMTTESAPLPAAESPRLSLSVDDTHLNGDAIPILGEMSTLELLTMSGAGLTTEDLWELGAMLPNCQIFDDLASQSVEWVEFDQRTACKSPLLGSIDGSRLAVFCDAALRFTDTGRSCALRAEHEYVEWIHDNALWKRRRVLLPERGQCTQVHPWTPSYSRAKN